MRLIVIFIVTFYCLYHHVNGNQQSNQDDPNRPFWATRGRRSGSRLSVKADDDIPEKWAEDYGATDLLEKDSLLRNKQQASTLLATLLTALYPWEGEIIRKRGDGKTADPQNPFWAARG